MLSTRLLSYSEIMEKPKLPRQKSIKPKRWKEASDEEFVDPFSTFKEWESENDEQAFKKL